jgi:hypothetical protein
MRRSRTGQRPIIALVLGMTAVVTVSAAMRASQAPAGNLDDWLINAPDDEARFKLLQRYLRGFDQPMWEVGERFQSIYDALTDENYDLAVYHWEKIKTTIVNGYMKRPKRRANADALFVNGAYEPVLEAFKSKDATKAWGGFEQARSTCQACHDAEKVGFVNNQPLFRRTATPPRK